MATAKQAKVTKTGRSTAAAKSTAKKAASKDGAKKATAKKPAATKKAAAKATTTKKAPAKGTATKKAPAKAAAKRSAGANGSGGSPAAGSTPYDAKFLAQQEALLLAERETYLRQADALQAEADQLAAEREPGDVQFDEESGEGDTLQVERERDLALSARARQEIAEIDRALSKIKDRSYGVCEVSGKPIPKERLRAIPQARVRVEYKTGGFGQR